MGRTLFSPEPKEKREELFNRDEELETLLTSIRKGEKLIVIQGIRRIGKSSLLNVALNECRYPSLKLDLREIYFTHSSISKFHFYRALSEEFSKLNKLYNLSSILKRIKGVKISGLEVEFDWSKEGVSLPTLFKTLDGWASSRGRMVIAFDEAQYFRLAGRIRYDGILAWAIDNLPNITFILTGSQVGLLQDFLGLEDPDSPLCGRYARVIQLKRLGTDQSLKFLEEGFKQAKVKSPSNLDEVIHTLSGLIGWLTLYGYVFVTEGEAELKQFLIRASKIAESEIKKILHLTDRYFIVLKVVAQGASTWSRIYDACRVIVGPISKSNLSYLLENLVKYGYLERLENGSFSIPDPIIKHLAISEF
jgi:hypothetical protein